MVARLYAKRSQENVYPTNSALRRIDLYEETLSGTTTCETYYSTAYGHRRGFLSTLKEV